VSVAFFGDGAMGQGILYEAMNMAALWRLPVLFCCINNQYGMGTRVDRSAGHRDFPARAAAFGLAAARADGADVEAVHDAARALVADARAGRPAFLEIDAYRFFGHARMDKSPYRTPEEEAEGRARDPVLTARARVAAAGLASDADLDRIDAAAAAEMDAALAAAIAAPAPVRDTMFEDVFAPGTPAPRPQAARLTAILGEGGRA
jgi:pyruvate dehydrogenase E1 component alpha subunit